MVVREARPPVSTEFSRVIREVNLGLSLDDALANLQRRVRSDDLDLMTTAIAIHHTVGGNLAEILDSIAYTIRERVRIKGEIKTLTAQQRMSGYVVGFLPVALVILLSVIAPSFMEPMLRTPPELLGLPLGLFILGCRRADDGRRLHPHPPHRRYRGLAMLPLIVAALAGLGVLLVFFAFAGSRPMDPVQARLSQLGSMQARTLEEIELQQPLFERTLRPMAARLSGIAQRFASPQKVSRTESRLMMGGNPGDLRTIDFLGMKLVVAGLTGGGRLRDLWCCAWSRQHSACWVALPSAAWDSLLPEVWLSRRIKRRQHRILLDVPDTLDLLTISVRAGLSFDGALAKVIEKTPGPLADEFRRALAEIRVGKVRRDALRDVVARTDVPALSNFIGAIIQAEQLGVPIAQGAPDPVGAAAHRAPPACRGDGRQGTDQDALPARWLHLPVDVHRHPRPGGHPDLDQHVDWALTCTGWNELLLRRCRADGAHVLWTAEVAGSWMARLRGLIGRPALEPGAGLFFPGTNGVHMLFMRFAIDCVFVGAPRPDGSRQVVARAVQPAALEEHRLVGAWRARRNRACRLGRRGRRECRRSAQA